MNWVGGARSRLKLQNERRVQKDYFDRKRLMSKVKHARPLSPGDRHSKKHISQDLLFLQAVSNAHSTANKGLGEAEAAPRQVNKVDMGKARSFDRPDRDLELPMSPIGKPSTLELLDASASLSFYAEDQPKVSTQKIPHQTHLDSFGLGLKERAREEQQQAASHSTSIAGDSLSALCMTESVFPKVKQSQHVKQHHCRQVPKKVTTTHSNTNAASWESFCEARGFGDKEKSISHTAKRKQTSFDHETPFNFGAQAIKKPRLQMLPPKTKGSLLDFHNRERETGNGYMMREGGGWRGEEKAWLTAGQLQWRGQSITKPVGNYPKMVPFGAEEMKPVESMAAHVPLEKSAEPTAADSAKEASFPWTSTTTTSFSRGSSTSSLLDEDPLSYMKHIDAKSRADIFQHNPPPQAKKHAEAASKSVSTLFDESIFGPLSNQKTKKQHQNSAPQGKHVETSCLPQSAVTVFDESIFGPLLGKRHNTAEPNTHASSVDPMLPQPQEDSGKPLSMFEQMMLSFEEHRSSAESPKEEQKLEGASARHMEWKNFICGTGLAGEFHLGTEELQNSKPTVDTDGDDPLAQSSNKASADDGAVDQHHQPVRKENTKLFPGFQVRNKNITMEELLCLDEEITSSLESVSQDITLTPGVFSTEDPIGRVPDIDSQSSEEYFSSKTCKEIRKDLIGTESHVEHQDEMTIQTLAADCSSNQVATGIDDDCSEITGMVGNSAFCCTKKMHCSTQTELAPVKICKEVSCECNIWTGKTVQQCRHCQQGEQGSRNSTSTQTLPSILLDCEMQTDPRYNHEGGHQSVSTQTEKPMPDIKDSLMLESIATSYSDGCMNIAVQFDRAAFSKDQSTQTDTNNNEMWSQVDANVDAKSESLSRDCNTCTTADACTQTSPNCTTVEDLQAEIRYLKEKLALVESTVVWQSVMMKLYQM